MKTNLIKRIITIAAAVAVTLAIGAGGAFAQGSVPDKGIVKDGNLVWLKNANCFGTQNWYDAMRSAASLKSGMCGLTDGSTAGQWRLPTKDELRARQRNQQGFNNVHANFYWSSTVYTDYAYNAWSVSMYEGNVYGGAMIGLGIYVWPVRTVQ